MTDSHDFWRDRPVLITGATGLVGSYVTNSLLDQDADVICLVRDWVPQSEVVSSGNFGRTKVVRGDIQDAQLLERVIGEYEIDTIFHLAAQTIVPIANRNPLSTFDTNITGTYRLLEAARRNATVKQIIVASSDKAYGEHVTLPYTEEMPLQGRYPYDVSKSCTDLISQSYASTYGLPIIVTRCGNFYGGGDLNWNRLVPGTIRSIVRGQSPEIRSDGSFIRDYFYVEDGAAAYLFVAQKLAENPSLAGEAFNFSTETQVTVLQLVHRIADLMDSQLPINVRNQSTHEIRHQYLSAQKARDRLGWKPLFSLDEGLQRTIAWYKRFFEDSSIRDIRQQEG